MDKVGVLRGSELPGPSGWPLTAGCMQPVGWRVAYPSHPSLLVIVVKVMTMMQRRLCSQ